MIINRVLTIDKLATIHTNTANLYHTGNKIA